VTAHADLLYETLDAVTEAAGLGDATSLPEGALGWRQDSWCLPWYDEGRGVCGTAACFAGHRLVLDGYVVSGYDAMTSPGGAVIWGHQIEALAEARLGLTPVQSRALFRGDNDLARIKEVVDNIVAGGCGLPECGRDHE